MTICTELANFIVHWNAFTLSPCGFDLTAHIHQLRQFDSTNNNCTSTHPMHVFNQIFQVKLNIFTFNYSKKPIFPIVGTLSDYWRTIMNKFDCFIQALCLCEQAQKKKKIQSGISVDVMFIDWNLISYWLTQHRYIDSVCLCCCEWTMLHCSFTVA